ncbi:MAG: hypothetical protein J6W81_03270 [Lentisphaeria bacterium]|nr:hypothetical protein [Lentisphaeria bacterium]
MNCYYIDSTSQQQGPFPDLWISILIDGKKLPEDLQVWGEQIGEWLPWNEYKIQCQNYTECPFCGEQLQIKQEFLDKKLQCPKCSQKFHLNRWNMQGLFNLFDGIDKKKSPDLNVEQWFAQKQSLHKDNIFLEYITYYPQTPGLIEALEDEANNDIANHIFLLSCLLFKRQLRWTSLLEFRSYYSLAGFSEKTFDALFSCELPKAFAVIHHDTEDYNAISEFEVLANYYAQQLNSSNGIHFVPVYNSLYQWYEERFIKALNGNNYLTMLEEFHHFVSGQGWEFFAQILKKQSFRKQLEDILCKKIKFGNFNKKELDRLMNILGDFPFAEDILYTSERIQNSLRELCLNTFNLILQNQESVMPDFAYDLLGDMESVDKQIAEKLIPVILHKEKSFEEVRRIFDIMEYFGFLLNLTDKFSSIKKIFPYLLSDDSSAVLSMPAVIVEKKNIDCPECQGTGNQLCPQCNGTKKMPCPKCGGTGQEYSYDRHHYIYCKKCQGRELITCDNDCQKDKKTGKYVVPCNHCGKTGTVSEIQIEKSGVLALQDQKFFWKEKNSGKNHEIKFPIRKIIPLQDTNKKKTEFYPDKAKNIHPLFCADEMEGYLKDFYDEETSLFFIDQNDTIFCCKHDTVESLLDLISEFFLYQDQLKRSGENRGQTEDLKNSEDISSSVLTENLTKEEKVYLKSYLFANKDGFIDSAERKMLEYQASQILKLSSARVLELEAMATLLNEGDL